MLSGGNYSLVINVQPGSLNIDCFVMLETLEALTRFHCSAAVSIMDGWERRCSPEEVTHKVAIKKERKTSAVEQKLFPEHEVLCFSQRKLS